MRGQTGLSSTKTRSKMGEALLVLLSSIVQAKIAIYKQSFARLSVTYGAAEVTYGAAEVTYGAAIAH